MQLDFIIRIGLAKKNMSQKDLARKINVAPSAVSSWCSGASYPSGEKLLQLAKELDIVEELFPNKKKDDQNDSLERIDKIDKIDSRLSELEKKVSFFVTQNNNHQYRGTIINKG